MEAKDISIEEVKAACKNSLHFLCTEILGFKDWDMVHDDMEKFVSRKSIRKLLLVPRGHLKTAMITKGFTIQSILRNPDVRVLIANQVWDKSREMLYEIKQLLTEKQTYQSYLETLFQKDGAKTILLSDSEGKLWRLQQLELPEWRLN